MAPVRKEIKAANFEQFLNAKRQTKLQCRVSLRTRKTSVDYNVLLERNQEKAERNPFKRTLRKLRTRSLGKTLQSGIRQSKRRLSFRHLRGKKTRQPIPDFLLQRSAALSRLTGGGLGEIQENLQVMLSTGDSDLQKKLEHEVKMMDGAHKLLAAANHVKQGLEATKTLLAAHVKMSSYMAALRKKKEESARPAPEISIGTQVPCLARVSISDLRVPLIWKDSDHFKNKGNHHRYSAFCVVQVGVEVCDTFLVHDIDRSHTDIAFEDCLVLQNVPYDFECKVQLFVHEHCDDLTIASTSTKLKKKFNTISSSVGRKLSGLKEPMNEPSSGGPKFEMMAELTLMLEDVKDSVGTYDLTLNTDTETIVTLPLFGNMCCRIVAQPHCLTKETVSGYLLVQEGQLWTRYFCILQNRQIGCWTDGFLADMQEPLFIVPVTKSALITDADPNTAERPHMFHVRQMDGGGQEMTLAAETQEGIQDWWDGLQQHLLDQVVWRKPCESLMEIRSLNYVPSYKRKAIGLYTKTAAKGEPSNLSELEEGSPLTLVFNRLTRSQSQLRKLQTYPQGKC